MKRFFGGVIPMLDNILESGVRPGMSPAEESAVNKANLFYLLACLLAVMLLVEDVGSREYAQSPAAFVILIAALFCFAVLSRTGRPFLPNLLLLGGLSVYALARTAGESASGTEYALVFGFPFLYFLAFPFRGALALFFALLTALVVILAVPGEQFFPARYGLTERLHIILVYVFFGCTALLAEFVHWRAQQKIRRLVAELVAASRTDQLTGLYNRRAFLERFQYEVMRSRRENLPLSIVLFDVDYFKAVNDEYGHGCGDAVLQYLARLIRAAVRQQDTVVRWGGEEFILLLPATSLDGAVNLAEKLRIAVEDSPYTCADKVIRLTLSLGVHCCNLAESLDANISCADAKLYRAKHLGRNRVCTDLTGNRLECSRAPLFAPNAR